MWLHYYPWLIKPTGKWAVEAPEVLVVLVVTVPERWWVVVDGGDGQTPLPVVVLMGSPVEESSQRTRKKSLMSVCVAS